MGYVSQQDILTLISNSELPDFTDDDRNGEPDSGILDTIISDCSTMADAYVSSLYNTPFNPVPSKIKTATLYFVAESLYFRRLTPEDKNPFTHIADEWRNILQQIGAGTLPLDANIPSAFTPGFAITTPSIVNASTF